MRLGLVCISEILRDQGWAFKTMTRKSFNSLSRQDAIEKLSSVILHNSKLVGRIVFHCRDMNIAHYRISSSLMPLLSDPTLNMTLDMLPDCDAVKANLEACGEYARLFNISLSCHPDQYNQLGSKNPNVVANTIRELNHQSMVMDLFNCPRDHSAPMTLHVGASPKNEMTIEFVSRFLENFKKCDEGVQRRLIAENQDSGFWNSSNLFVYFGMAFPLCFDNLHYQCAKNERWMMERAAEYFAATWGKHTPIFHWSESKSKLTPRSHADYASHIPEIVLRHPNVVWEVELKAKDKAIADIFEKKLDVLHQV